VKVASFVNPLVQASGPGFNYGGVEVLAKLLQPLDREARCDCMLITGRWFSYWARQNGKAHLLTGLRTVWLDELLLYRRIRELGALPTALDQTAHQADDTEQPALRIIAEMVAPHVNGFEPDIIIGSVRRTISRSCGRPRSVCTSNRVTLGEIRIRSVFTSIISGHMRGRQSRGLED
jgi:hypothetical protein